MRTANAGANVVNAASSFVSTVIHTDMPLAAAISSAPTTGKVAASASARPASALESVPTATKRTDEAAEQSAACFSDATSTEHSALQNKLRFPSLIRRMITISKTSSRTPGLLSVTESVVLPPQPKGGHMSNFSRLSLREWLVPPVLMPIFLVLLVAAAMVIQW